MAAIHSSAERTTFTVMPRGRARVWMTSSAVSYTHLDVYKRQAVAWLFASIFFHVLAHIAVYVFFSLYLDSLGYRKTTIGLLWAVSVVLEIGWFFMQGRWMPLLLSLIHI